MKRALSCLLCLALLMPLCPALAGCASEAAAAEASPAVSASPSPSVKPKAESQHSPESKPEPSPKSEPEPSPEPLKMADYSCRYFTSFVPYGWKVSFVTFDAGGGVMRIAVNITDPEDSNNRIFYTSALEPLFVSQEAKEEFLPNLSAYYSSSPVLEDGPSAKATLSRWSGLYSLMLSEELGCHGYFDDYQLKETLWDAAAPRSTDSFTRSGVLALVGIPEADGDYVLYYENSLALQPAPEGLSYDARYYISYDNFGIVISDKLYDAWYPTLLDCMRSMNLYAFNGQRDIMGENGRLTVDAPRDIPLP